MGKNRVIIGKGSNRRPSNVSRETFLDQHERIFGKKAVQRGRFKYDPASGEYISAYDWHVKYGRKEIRTHYVQGDLEPYQSPIDDTVINSRRGQRYDLEKNGCRIYEGREAEQKEADRHNAYKQAASDELLEKRLWETANELRWKNVKPETRIKSGWLIGED